MLFIAFIIVALLSFLGWYFFRDAFSPFVLAPGVWFGVLLLYYIAQPDFYEVKNVLPIAIVLWNVGFLSIAYLVYYLLPTDRGLLSLRPFLYDNVQPSKKVIKAYWLITAFVMPYMLYKLVMYGLERGEVNLFLYIRLSSVMEDFDKPDFGLTVYLVPIATILLILAVGYIKNKWAILSAILLNVVSGLTTMSKTQFFVLIIVVVYIYYRQQKVKLRSIAVIIMCFLVFSVWFQYSRAMEDEQATFSATNMLSLYTMSPLIAFDYYAQAASSPLFGANVFRFFYAVLYALGSNTPPEPTILTFVGVPDLTNTYTILYPFYTDFGLWGVFLFGGIYGALFSFLYKRGKDKDNIYFAIYACLVNYLVLQFVQENIFSNLSLIIQYVVLLLIPFLVSYKQTSKNSTQ